ncbi:hypothetical protein KSS87_017071, partial [Heliosperma pusillum]
MRGSWRKWEMKEKPPNDDVCPVCFGDFTLPCRTSCGSCILKVWNYGSPFQPCKCPMCCSHIKSLTPLASTNHYKEDEAEATLKTIEKYNHLFVGGIRGIVPMVLALLYLISPFDFIPPDVNIIQVCNCFAVLMVGFLKFRGFYTRRRSAQRARQMAARLI